MYTLELLGFLNFRRIQNLTLEQARQAWLEASKERWLVRDSFDEHYTRWNMWELWLNGELVNSGQFSEHRR